MKARTLLSVPGSFGVFLVVIFALVAGCKSTPEIDWNSRIGYYTFDQAVLEMGPPDRTAKLGNGQTVAEWIHYSNSGFSFGMGTGYSGGNGAVGVAHTVDTGYNSKVLRLIFDPDNKLVSWSKNY